MDSRQSLFQKLPADIISKIIDFIPDGCCCHCFLEADKVALVQVCHAWRNVAASKFLNKLVVDIRDTQNVRYEYIGYTQYRYPFKLVSHRYVSMLIIVGATALFETRRALDWIESVDPKEFYFPTARCLHFAIFAPVHLMEFSPSHAAGNYGQFVVKVSKLTPNAKDLVTTPHYI
ncbi:hypothetical protein LPJ53_005337 [Coemansia erecta]|uniref:F-box domain-containing protein n=1 Tax=Coemansia erecta TaxID=147472 RepID=A0A9W7XSP8_9FUNG|nr:hypothetical protein LPJ53_005337 [Coemansia erecta]